MGIREILSQYSEGRTCFDHLDDVYSKAISVYSYNLTKEDIKKYTFEYGRIPTPVIIELIQKNHPEIPDDFNSFEEYHAWYISQGDTPNHNTAWAVIIANGINDSEILEDGWHRLHSYIRDNLEYIPFVIYHNS